MRGSCIKVIKCEQKLVLMMMWCMWELIRLMMMHAGALGVKKGKNCGHDNQQNVLVAIDFSEFIL